MDLRMPVMDGYEATKQLKQNPSTQKIPVIALTADVLSKQSKAYEFDCLLSKPETEVVEFDTMTNLTPSEKCRLPELIETLEKTFMPELEELLGTLDMYEIEVFASSIMRLGEEYHIEGLIHYGNELSEFTQVFDITLIENTLTLFPKLIYSLKKV